MKYKGYEGLILALFVSLFILVNVARLTFLQIRKGSIVIAESSLVVSEVAAIGLAVICFLILVRSLRRANDNVQKYNAAFLTSVRHAFLVELSERLALVLVISLLGIPLGFEIAVRIGTDIDGFLALENLSGLGTGILLALFVAYSIWRYYKRITCGKSASCDK